MTCDPCMHTGIDLDPRMHTGIWSIPVCIRGSILIPICIKGIACHVIPVCIRGSIKSPCIKPKANGEQYPECGVLSDIPERKWGAIWYPVTQMGSEQRKIYYDALSNTLQVMFFDVGGWALASKKFWFNAWLSQRSLTRQRHIRNWSPYAYGESPYAYGE